jgi:hypothetical protein
MPVPELVISSMNFPPYAVRGVAQTLQPIDAATQIARTVNGILIDVSDPDNLFRQFQSEITCPDIQIPEFCFPGIEVTVDCVVELGFKTSGGTQIRAHVPGSGRTDGDYTFYRPRLTMLVVSWAVNHDEWSAVRDWTLNLEESTVETGFASVLDDS